MARYERIESIRCTETRDVQCWSWKGKMYAGISGASVQELDSCADQVIGR